MLLFWGTSHTTDGVLYDVLGDDTMEWCGSQNQSEKLPAMFP